MHYYACPYCDPCEKAHLFRVIAKDMRCKYEKDDGFCEENHKCKEVMECQKCKNQWTILKKFLKDQKRKIKDG